MVFPSDGSGNARQSSCVRGAHKHTRPSPEHTLWAQGCTSQRGGTHAETYAPHTHTLRRTGLCNWVQLALLPIGYQYEPFRFVCAGRGDATHAALHRPSLQSDHPWKHMALLWHSTWLPSYRTQQAALQAAVANRGVAPHHSYSTPGCLATRSFSCKVVNRHGTESETPRIIHMACLYGGPG